MTAEERFNGEVSAGKVLCVMVRDDAQHSTKTGLERLVPVADKADFDRMAASMLDPLDVCDQD